MSLYTQIEVAHIKAHIFNHLSTIILRPCSTPDMEGGVADGVLPHARCARSHRCRRRRKGTMKTCLHIIGREYTHGQSMLMLLML